MAVQTYTVAFEGVEAKLIEVQCAVAPGLPGFTIVGLPNKAVSEARERVRAALAALSIALPAKRITINLSPADMPKHGAHFDLAIAVALLAALDMIPADEIEQSVIMGELSLDGALVAIPGTLPAAMTAASEDRRLICPKACGAEAAWVDAAQVLAADGLGDVLRHFTGQAPLIAAQPGQVTCDDSHKDMAEVKGQERAKRALEIAAAGRHHVLLTGAPGSGKSMMAARLPGILPPLGAVEALETSMVHSLAGLLDEGGISRSRPFRDPHHTSSMAAIVGGGRNAGPGEVSLAHNGVLFLDEFPEFPRQVLDTLRQPIETGEVVVARANAHARYPCRFMLVAAANPCRCGYLTDPDRACGRAPICSEEYLSRISGPLMDRFDLRVDVPPVSFADLDAPASGEPSAVIRDRVIRARAHQADRYRSIEGVFVNADTEGQVLEKTAFLTAEAKTFLAAAAEHYHLSARGYHRVIRVSRTIADLAESDDIAKHHVAEALSFRVGDAPVAQPRMARNAAAAPQPAAMAMISDSTP